jgi:head-tail adaptor
MLSPRTSIAERPHRVQLQNPGPPQPNGDGGSTQTWGDLDPPFLWMAIVSSAGGIEQRAARAEGSTLSVAMYTITGQYHPQVTTLTRLLFNGREFHVNGITNVTERGIEMQLSCTELTP